MDYTAVLSRFEGLFSGVGGVFLIAALGVLAIFGAHIVRMRFSRTQKARSGKSYQNVVIEPYAEHEEKDPLDAMMPQFSTNQKQI